MGVEQRDDYKEYDDFFYCEYQAVYIFVKCGNPTVRRRLKWLV